MKVQPLLERWQSQSRSSSPRFRLQAELGPQDVARLQALAEMYPGCSVESMLADLIHVALDDLEASFPFVNGPQVGEDECGDPVYEDAGPTPRFLALTRKHLRTLSQSAGALAS
ncbi:MAG: type 1 pili tip component [Moraxellaceae bacterium]|jgi:hypothetical protein|nr:type 1 pili tip component [Moraxellaceae bacterium]MDF3030262.1 type 1 pili tip component [Moraxellaceae bacterium]